MERNQEEAPSSRAEELNSLVWLYLRTVNDKLADTFREQTKAREHGAGEPTLEDLYDHYHASTSRGNLLKRRAELPANSLHNEEPRNKKIPKSEPEVIDLTMLSDTDSQEDLLRLEANAKTDLYNKKNGHKVTFVQGIGCLCCNPQPGSSIWKPGKELVGKNVVDPRLLQSTHGETPPRLLESTHGKTPQKILRLTDGETPPQILQLTHGETPPHLLQSTYEETPPQILQLTHGEIPPHLLQSTHGETPPHLLQSTHGETQSEEKRHRMRLLELTPKTNASQSTNSALRSEHEIEEGYHKMLELEARQQLIPNLDAFTCGVCLCDYEVGEGVMLRECLHTFCRECLGNLVRHCDDFIVVCPHRGDDNEDCGAKLEEREVRALVSEEDYEKRLQKTMRLAETQMQDAYHCRTADCTGWCVHDENAVEFLCPVCNQKNCLKCKAIHNNENCEQYKRRIDAEESFQGASGAKTKQAIDKMIEKKTALPCPRCNIIVIKDKHSCDWVQCAVCKCEICWATRGPRWGPLGHGDQSGGCGCLVNGKRCHPKCRNCH